MNHEELPRACSVCLLCFLLSSVHWAAWGAAIGTQPRNSAVLLQQEATFSVTASGIAPLTYQWRIDGRQLTGATNRTLLLTNIALSNLGSYDVVVRDSVGTVTSVPAFLTLATRWTELVVFGASAEKPTCGGLAWPEYVANRLGIRLRNYAQDGARSSGIRSQITTYLRTNTPTASTLVAHWAGGSLIDLRFGASPEHAASNRLANMRLLMNAGARSFVMPTPSSPRLQPNFVAGFPEFTAERVMAFDAGVSEGLKALATQYELRIYRPDIFTLSMAMLENPALYGFSVPPGPQGPFLGPFTCDGGHFTSPVHALIAQEIHRSLTSPLRIDSAAQTLDGGIALKWGGGSPPFRLQETFHLLSGEWETVAELDLPGTAIPRRDRSQRFFRVLSLGQ